jgi:hypothetical protein
MTTSDEDASTVQHARVTAEGTLTGDTWAQEARDALGNGDGEYAVRAALISIATSLESLVEMIRQDAARAEEWERNNPRGGAS